MYEQQVSGTTKSTRLTVFAALAAAVIFKLISGAADYYVWVFEILFVAAVVYAIYVTLRYTMTNYIYRVKERTVEIAKKTGRREETVFELPYDKIKRIYPDRESADFTDIPKGRRLYYCPSMKPKERYVMEAINDEKLPILVFLECDAKFAERLRAARTAWIKKELEKKQEQPDGQA